MEGVKEDKRSFFAKEKLVVCEQVVALAYVISLPFWMTPSWILLIAGLVLSAIDLIRNETSRQKLKDACPLLLPLLIFAAAVFASGLAGGLGSSLHDVSTLKAILSYFFASLIFVRAPATAVVCVVALLSVGAVAGVYGGIQQITGFRPGYQFEQCVGFLKGPMPYAGQMQMFSMLAFGFFLSKGHKSLPGIFSKTPFFIAIVICNMLGLEACGERSAWVGGIAGVLAATIILSWRTLAKAVVALAVAAMLLYAFVPLVKSRVSSLFAPNEVSSRSRIVIWQRAISEWQSSPVLGIGFTKFPHLNIQDAVAHEPTKDLNHAHSNYLQVLATCGIVGLLAYLWLQFCVLAATFKMAVSGRKSNQPLLFGCGLGLFAAMCSLCVSGLFEYNFGTAQVRLAQWFLLGLLALSASKTEAS